jgi:hypothetical protein
LRLGGGFDVPLHQRHIQRGGHLLGQHGLAGARLALDQQRALQRQSRIHGQFQVIGRDVLVGSFKALRGLHTNVSQSEGG